MPTDLTIAIPASIQKGTPVPSRVVSPAKLRTAKLPFSQDLARDIESLSHNLNSLHGTLTNSPPAITIPLATDTAPGLVKPDGVTITIDATGSIHAPPGIDLETNGVNNGSQAKLNLVAGSNITLVDDGAGNVTLTATSAPSLIEVNGSPVGPAGLAANGLVIGFVIGNGATGTNVGPMLLAPHLGTLSACTVLVKASDGTTALAFDILRNGASIFSTSPTVAAGAASGNKYTFTGLASPPITVAQNDVFSINITSGSSAWIFTAQLD